MNTLSLSLSLEFNFPGGGAGGGGATGYSSSGFNFFSGGGPGGGGGGGSGGGTGFSGGTTTSLPTMPSIDTLYSTLPSAQSHIFAATATNPTLPPYTSAHHNYAGQPVQNYISNGGGRPLFQPVQHFTSVGSRGIIGSRNIGGVVVKPEPQDWMDIIESESLYYVFILQSTQVSRIIQVELICPRLSCYDTHILLQFLVLTLLAFCNRIRIKHVPFIKIDVIGTIQFGSHDLICTFISK